MIRFEQVGKRYPNGHVGLHELSFRVRRGEREEEAWPGHFRGAAARAARLTLRRGQH